MKFELLDQFISPIIEDQFSEYWQENGQGLIAFIKAYYEWLELEDNPIFLGKKFPEYRDIDTTVDEFFVYFKEQYLKNIQFETTSNKKLFIKNSLDFYRAKGTERAVDLFFKLIYGEDADVYYPGDDIFRLSSGDWVVPTYLEISRTERNPDYVNKQITGVDSGATAFVERLVRRRVNGKFIDIFYLSAINGDFKTGELVTYDGSTENVPAVIGSLTTMEIISGGANFNIGDTVIISGGSGGQAKARVANTINTTGIVEFSLVDGGWGYSNTANVAISERIVTLDGIRTSNTPIFQSYEQMTQPLARLNYTSATGVIDVGDVLENYHGNGAVAANAVVLTLTPNVSVSNAGVAFISPITGNVAMDSTFSVRGNTVTAVIDSYGDESASFNILGYSDDVKLTGISWNEMPFLPGEILTQGNTSARISSVSYDGTNVVIQTINSSGTFSPDQTVTGQQSNATANVIHFGLTIGAHNISNTIYTEEGNRVAGNSGITAIVTGLSTGSGAGFNVGELDFVETVIVGTDYLSDYNTGGVQIYDLRLNGSNSNVAANGYGFPKLPSGNLNSIMFSYLDHAVMDVGRIVTITGINPGSDYTSDPYVRITQPEIIPYDKHDYTLAVDNMSGMFYIGEVVEQAMVSNVVNLTVTSAGNFQIGEMVYQNNGTSNIAFGVIRQSTITSNAGALMLRASNGTFSTSYQIRGTSSLANAAVASVANSSITDYARGIVLSSPSTNEISIRRVSWNTDWIPGLQVQGIASGSVATIAGVCDLTESNISGNNAIVTANVLTANGSATNLIVTDSGFGYANGEVISFVSEDGERGGMARLVLGKQGKSTGFFRGTDGFLSADKYLHDCHYYQEYSYEIRSKLPLEKYADMAKKVLHVAGTRMYGAIYTSSTSNTEIIASPSEDVTYDLTINSLANTESLIIGERIIQGELFTPEVGDPIIVTEEASGIIASHKAIVVVPGQNNPYYEYGGMIYQPSAAVNAASAILMKKVADVAANTTTLYLDNVQGTFAPSINTYGYNMRYKLIEPLVKLTLGTVIGANTITKSFAEGEVVTQGGASGTVLKANSSVALLQWTSGDFTSGVNATANGKTALVNHATNRNFTNNETIWQDTLTLTVHGNTANVIVGEDVSVSVRNNDGSLTFMNTATGTVLGKNTSSVTLHKSFGVFRQGDNISTATSNVILPIIGVRSQNTVIAKVTNSSDTWLVVYDSSGPYTMNSYVQSDTAIAKITAQAANVAHMGGVSTISALNNITVQNTTGQFLSGPAMGMTGNAVFTITGVNLNG